MKVTKPKVELAVKMAWVNDFNPTSIRLVGLLEILAAIGLVAPMVTGILPILTPLAAAGLILTMVGAALLHLRRNEHQMIFGNLVLLLIADLVLIGRLVEVPA